MQGYDPLVEPDPEEWLALDEQIRASLVEDYHRRARVRLPRTRRTAHALMHVMVENQIAGSDPAPVRQTMARLMTEGLDRHEALHAIASIAIGQLTDAVRDQKPFSTERYIDELQRLTAESWRRWAD